LACAEVFKCSLQGRRDRIAELTQFLHSFLPYLEIISHSEREKKKLRLAVVALSPIQKEILHLVRVPA